MCEPDPPDRTLTWAMLLGQWTEFARSAVALPETGEAGRYRGAVAPLITLHAVTHALGELDRLDTDQRSLAGDRAEILIRRESETLRRIWHGEDPPDAIRVFIREAVSALDRATHQTAWFEWIVTTDSVVFDHPAPLLGLIAESGLPFDLYVPSPGVPFFAGAVAACLGCGGDETPDAVLEVIAAFLGQAVEGPERATEPRQVCRQFDFARGGPVRDVIAPMSVGEVPGQPLLVLGLRRGEARPVSPPPRSPVDLGVLPVVEWSETEG